MDNNHENANEDITVTKELQTDTKKIISNTAALKTLREAASKAIIAFLSI